MQGPVRRSRSISSKLAYLAVCAGAATLACDPAPQPGADTAPPAKGSTKAAGPRDPAPEGTPPATDPLVAEPEAPRLVADPLPKPPEGPHPLGARDLIALERLSDHRVSPDGESVVFVRRTLDHATGKGLTDLWLVPTRGGTPSRLTDHEASDTSPRWSPDGKSLFFLSSRGGSSQVWRMPAGGGEAEAITELPLPVANLEVSPAGDRIAFTLDVFVDCEDLACTKARLDAAERDPSRGQAYEQLMVRHWDHFRDGRRSHLFTLPLASPGAQPVDLVRGRDADVPSQPFGGSDEFTFSPDGTTLIYTARDVGKSEAWSTNFDLFAVAADGSGERRPLTADNLAWDTTPVFSPDGNTLAWVAMATPGYEADRFRIKVRSWPDGEVRTLADDWDRSVGSLRFAPDGASLLVTAPHLGQVGVFSVALADGAVTERLTEGHASAPAYAGDRIVLAHDDLRHPVDLWSIPASGGSIPASGGSIPASGGSIPASGGSIPASGSELVQLTSLNADRMAQVQLGEPEQFTFPGWKGETVHGYVVGPVGRREGEKYPVAFLIHGGPQGSFGNHFHYRWNPQTYAGAGYAAVMIDFHGSTGYGQAFTDSIQGDWGGKPLVDLQEGLAAALERYPWLDGERACALGASYGGFMINWIAGRWPDRFRCLVNHDGVFDQRAMYFGTEELWFPEREFGGPYFDSPKGYEASNPVSFVKQWRTPMLVVQGALDYRVPETQGLATFTALQRRGIPSRYLHFPDENHWVLSPANSLQWHAEVEAWLGRWLADAPSDAAP